MGRESNNGGLATRELSGYQIATEEIMDDATQTDFAASETEAASASQFETEAKAIEEDRLRAKNMRRALPTPGPTGWLNYKDRAWLRRQSAGHPRQPLVHVKAAKQLAEKAAGWGQHRLPFANPGFVSGDAGDPAVGDRCPPAGRCRVHR